MKLRLGFPLILALLVTLPGILIRLSGVHAPPHWTALIAGSAILGASFLLLWACDAAQSLVSQALALAVVALIAVLPEYAVDMYFTWQAGKSPDGNYAQYAIANMTGANRLLIGVAWGLIVLIFWVRFRKAVTIEKERTTELAFLGVATLYAFFICAKGTLAWYDGLVLVGIYVWYMILAGKRECTETEVEGPAELIVRLPKGYRRAATTALFLFAAGTILANAEPFCEGLVETGKILGINEFLLVQWLAPIASEAPEFIVALGFAWRGKAGMALGSLLSAKLNQWTLLVGMIPGAFAVSHQSLEHPIPMGSFQMQEILLTATQSFLAVVLLADLRLNIGGALMLFALFIGQLVLPGVIEAYPRVGLGMTAEHVHPLFSVLYVIASLAIVLYQPGPIARLVQGFRVHRPPTETTPATIPGGQ